MVVVGLGIYFAVKPKDKSADLLTDNQLNTQVQNTINNNITDNGAKIEDGQVSKPGDVLAMNYTGRLENGTVFDSNVDPKFNHVEPFLFVLGAGQVIQGWDEGLVGMKVGEKKTLTIAPEKAYGNRAVGSIPANSTLIFEVELLAINPKQ